MTELKPFAHYICPTGAGRLGHSSIYTGSYEQPRESDGTCICGAELVEENATKDGHRYRLTWESINPHVAADMEARNGRGAWPRVDFDALEWHEVTKEDDTPGQITAQYETLLGWAESHEQPIRNVRLERSTAPLEPTWEPV